MLINEKTLRVRIESVLEMNPGLYRPIETLPEPASEFLDPTFDDEPAESPIPDVKDRQPVIITVDDDEDTRNLIAEGLKQRYVIVQCQQAESLFAHIESNEMPDMILLDVKLPDMNGFDVIARLKADPKTATIPVIFITAASSNEDEIKAFQAGCVDYVRKPISLPVLKARIHNQLTLDRRRKCFEDRMARYLDSEDDAWTG
jgi:response regulator RpfG family c-di-GMP phosphodiesterase